MARFRPGRGNSNAGEEELALELQDVKEVAQVGFVRPEERRRTEFDVELVAAALGLRGGSSGELSG